MTQPTEDEDVEGVDVERVTAWLVDHDASLQPPFRFDLIAGGRSNLTFRVTDSAGRRVVLRRPPMSHVLSTAHDMGREHRIISALRGSQVPVPDTLGYCDDPAVNGRPFYVMEHVDGHILRSAPQTEKALEPAARRRASEHMVQVLVALHDVDVQDVGLADLGRHQGYIERQLKRWYGQFQQSQAQEKEAGVHRPATVVEEVYETLSSRVPDQQGVSIAHGDYKLDNCVIGDDGQVRAVLDWELCTLGDPLADLGTLSIYWADGQAPRDPRMAPSTSLPGFLTRSELADRYAALSGRDVSALPYYIAFGHWKLACIMEGVYSRFAVGAMGAQGAAAGSAQQVIHRGELARQALRDL